MTQEQIVESNKLIAEFMGWYQEKDDTEHWMYNDGTAIRVAYSEQNNYPHKGLPFHRSWDWLMPLVEKIERLKLGNISIDGDEYLNCEAGFEILPDSCNVYIQATMRLYDNLIHTNEKNKITSIYKAVVEFIKWYNENNLKNVKNGNM